MGKHKNFPGLYPQDKGHGRGGERARKEKGGEGEGEAEAEAEGRGVIVPRLHIMVILQ